MYAFFNALSHYQLCIQEVLKGSSTGILELDAYVYQHSYVDILCMTIRKNMQHLTRVDIFGASVYSKGMNLTLRGVKGPRSNEHMFQSSCKEVDISQEYALIQANARLFLAYK
ncbi:hypothetical protein SLEP1_g7871 [Rubroshorea leprosula]|uniref:Uncharacterized protein n=1 Tax=Rubroshorea leprosula TaxID=152421 RepID=A0AAV5I7T4_9ROSI|nr:hypothetical protein SLEP1_g7871 [Rubroshorea leprosula]